MAENATIQASRRTQLGTTHARRLRAEGQVPGVIYGHKIEPQMVTMHRAELETLLRGGGHGMIDVAVDGKKESAVIKEMQWDVFGRDVLHVDFLRVSLSDSVTMTVPIVLKGTAPGVVEGGMLEQGMHEIEVECRADSIPENITININELRLDDVVAVKNLDLPDGVAVTADPEQVVLQINPAPEEQEEEEMVDAAEPEVIRKEKAEEPED